MACVESPCFLLEHGTVRSSVYVCIPVDATLAERSPVLQNFLRSSGVKELPEGVTVDSFQTWCTVRCGNPLDTSKHEPEELVAALQVRMALAQSLPTEQGYDLVMFSRAVAAVCPQQQACGYRCVRRWVTAGRPLEGAWHEPWAVRCSVHDGRRRNILIRCNRISTHYRSI